MGASSNYAGKSASPGAKVERVSQAAGTLVVGGNLCVVSQRPNWSDIWPAQDMRPCC